MTTKWIGYQRIDIRTHHCFLHHYELPTLGQAPICELKQSWIKDERNLSPSFVKMRIPGGFHDTCSTIITLYGLLAFGTDKFGVQGYDGACRRISRYNHIQTHYYYKRHQQTHKFQQYSWPRVSSWSISFIWRTTLQYINMSHHKLCHHNTQYLDSVTEC